MKLLAAAAFSACNSIYETEFTTSFVPEMGLFFHCCNEANNLKDMDILRYPLPCRHLCACQKAKKELVGEVPQLQLPLFFCSLHLYLLSLFSSNENFTAKLLTSFSEEKKAWSESKR